MARYPPSATGSAPGVATTRRGVPSTSSVTPWASLAPETTTGTPGKARPSSSPVRVDPTVAILSPWPPHSGQSHCPTVRAHQRQEVQPRWSIANGPPQTEQ